MPTVVHCNCVTDHAVLFWSRMTAIATAVLVGGVLFAAAQFYLTRRNFRVTECGNLVKEWQVSALPVLQAEFDRGPELRTNAKNALTTIRIARERLELKLLELCRIAERTEIYVRKGVADIGIIAEHLGYDIIALYYYMRPLLRQLTRENDFNLEGFRDLVLRIQDYAKLNPLGLDIREDVVFAKIPPLRYIEGDLSKGYHKSLLRRLVLRALNDRRIYRMWKAWQLAWDRLNPF